MGSGDHMSLQVFCDWLAGTPPSLFIQTTSWIIPAVQTVHILSIGIVISTALVHLNTLGLAMRGYTSAMLSARFFPWLYWAVGVLLVSGAILVVAEPARSLPKGIFQLKMLLVIVGVALTMLYQLPLRKEPAHWDATPARRLNARVIAVVSLVIWSCIVFAGRWIAYV